VRDGRNFRYPKASTPRTNPSFDVGMLLGRPSRGFIGLLPLLGGQCLGSTISQ
jgi:hypothetical protein